MVTRVVEITDNVCGSAEVQDEFFCFRVRVVFNVTLLISQSHPCRQTTVVSSANLMMELERCVGVRLCVYRVYRSGLITLCEGDALTPLLFCIVLNHFN